MTVVDLAQVNEILVGDIGMLVAVRRMFKGLGLDLPNVQAMERRRRMLAVQVQKAIKEHEEDTNRPLIS